MPLTVREWWCGSFEKEPSKKPTANRKHAFAMLDYFKTLSEHICSFVAATNIKKPKPSKFDYLLQCTQKKNTDSLENYKLLDSVLTLDPELEFIAEMIPVWIGIQVPLFIALTLTFMQFNYTLKWLFTLSTLGNFCHEIHLKLQVSNFNISFCSEQNRF